MCRQIVENKLAEIFMSRYSINFLGKPGIKSRKLLNMTEIPARELLHVYFDVKDSFNIEIPENDVVNGRFDTFEHIVDIIIEQQLISGGEN